MSLVLSLASIFGKPVADGLIKGLGQRKDGPKRLEEAATAMAQGLTAIEALKQVFGKDFFSSLNDALGTSSKSKFSYEAGTQGYIQMEGGQSAYVKVLRDELNINLDRLTALEVKNVDLKNQFMGLMSIWQKRCEALFGTTQSEDIRATFASIQSILKGEKRNYRQIYELLSSTSLGGVGALMVISGVFVATGTGVGIASAISLFLFGIPWLTVGVLVLPGALLIMLAAKKTKPVDEISLSIALAYKLLDRIESSENQVIKNQLEKT